MNTQQLTCFLCAADKLNYTKAAHELFLSVPTITHHIQSLEEELGVSLFYHNKRSAQLTPEGQLFYKDAIDIMDRITLSKKRMLSQKNHTLEVLRIGCSSNAEITNLSSVLKLFHKECANIQPQLMVLQYDSLIQAILDEQLDIAFVSKDMIRNRRDFVFKKLKTNHTMLLGVKEPLTWDELENHTLIYLHHRNVPNLYDDKIQRKLDEHTSRHADYIVDGENMVFSMVEAGYGIGILPEHAILRDKKAFILDQNQEVEYGVIYREENRKKIDKFLGLIKKSLSEKEAEK